jgi:hypothetical protein
MLTSTSKDGSSGQWTQQFDSVVDFAASPRDSCGRGSSHGAAAQSATPRGGGRGAPLVIAALPSSEPKRFFLRKPLEHSLNRVASGTKSMSIVSRESVGSVLAGSGIGQCKRRALPRNSGQTSSAHSVITVPTVLGRRTAPTSKNAP